jgi:hypothetical protein
VPAKKSRDGNGNKPAFRCFPGKPNKINELENDFRKSNRINELKQK